MSTVKPRCRLTNLKGTERTPISNQDGASKSFNHQKLHKSPIQVHFIKGKMNSAIKVLITRKQYLFLRELYCLWYIDMAAFDLVSPVPMLFIDSSAKDSDNCERLALELFYPLHISVCSKVYFPFILCANNL